MRIFRSYSISNRSHMTPSKDCVYHCDPRVTVLPYLLVYLLKLILILFGYDLFEMGKKVRTISRER